MINSIEEINSIEDAIEYFENKGTSLTEEEKAIFYSDVLLKKNSDKKLVKICEVKKCHDGVWCEGEDYCEIHQKSEQEKLQSLVQQKFLSLSNPREVIRFETWWNNNLATVINYNDSFYRVFLVVYEPERGNEQGEVNWNKEVFIFPRYHDHNYWGTYQREKHEELEKAQGEAKWLRKELDGENPILAIHSYANEYKPFSWVVDIPYVVKSQVGSSTKTIDVPLFFVGYNSSTPTDLDKHFRPLDIVQVKCVDRKFGKRFYHVGFSMGNDTVFHFSGENNAIEKTNWDGFLRDSTRKIIHYHPIIPFKRSLEVVRQAVWAKDNNFWKGNYNLRNRNCEHFANMCIYGINYSKQMEDNKERLVAAVGIPGGMAVGAYAGLGVAGVASSLAFAAPTFGLSLIWGTASAVGAGVGSVGAVAASYDLSEVNNGKGSGINLKSEIEGTNKLLGEKSDYETEKYQKQYLQEVPAKEYCRIM